MPDQAMGTVLVDRPAQTAWDYSVVSIHARHNDHLEEKLKECGKQGWELFFINVPTPFEYLCVFRRPMH